MTLADTAATADPSDWLSFGLGVGRLSVTEFLLEMKRHHNEERSAGEKAREVLRTLTPSTPRTDEIVHRLRHATGLAGASSQQGFSSEKAVNDIRAEASIALKGVVGSLDAEQHPLTETMVDRAKTAVANWLVALGAA